MDDFGIQYVGIFNTGVFNKWGILYIFKALQQSLARMAIGQRVFQFQVCGRLAGLRKSNAIVDAYLKSIERRTPKPYLRPLSSFFPGAGMVH